MNLAYDALPFFALQYCYGEPQRISWRRVRTEGAGEVILNDAACRRANFSASNFRDGGAAGDFLARGNPDSFQGEDTLIVTAPF